MKSLIVVLLMACLAISMVLLPAPAHALCTQVIYAERAFSDGLNTQILGRTTSLATIIWFANTVDPEMARLIGAAVAQRNRVSVTGNATSCATSGTFRNQGTITSIFVSP